MTQFKCTRPACESNLFFQIETGLDQWQNYRIGEDGKAEQTDEGGKPGDVSSFGCAECENFIAHSETKEWTSDLDEVTEWINAGTYVVEAE